MTWLEEAKKRAEDLRAWPLDTTILPDGLTPAALANGIALDDAPRALALLERARASVNRCRILAIDCGDDHAERVAMAWLRDLEGKEALDA